MESGRNVLLIGQKYAGLLLAVYAAERGPGTLSDSKRDFAR